MNETTPIPTPRTDAFFATPLNENSFGVECMEFSMQLERELTVSKAEVNRLIGESVESDRMREFFEKGMDETAKERDQLRAELTKWRKVADDLVYALSLFHNSTEKHAGFIACEALAAHTLLTKKEDHEI